MTVYSCYEMLCMLVVSMLLLLLLQLMVWDRFVGDEEMFYDVFGRGRTPAGVMAPYEPFFGPFGSLG